jgi:hypothetical protein
MTTIPAENVAIRIADGWWQIIPDREDTLSTQPEFSVSRGGGVMEYTPGFGEIHKLPGTVLSVEYVQAVVAGYDKKQQRWRLGLHIAQQGDSTPHWRELVRWPTGDNRMYGAATQQAGRGLAEHIGCPLKIFGAKKITQPLDPAVAHGVTGPLVPHKREDIGPQQARLMAQSIDLPIQYPHMWLGRARNGVTLRLAKEATTDQKGEVTPSFNQCVINPEDGSIRLLPPTGLLGTFLSGQKARALKTSSVRNVELRHTIRQWSVPRKDEQGMLLEVTYTRHSWEVYLTLPDESLLLAQTTHQTSSELARRRATAHSSKFGVDTEAGIKYLRQHEADQKAYDAAEQWANAAAIVIASTLEVRVVKTEVDECS